MSEALVAFALLCALQFAVAFLSLRSERFQRLIKAQPTLLFYRGAFIEAELRKERVTEEEILAAMRGSGAASASDVDAVVLETDGSFRVISGVAVDKAVGTLRYVHGSSATVDEERRR